MTDFPEPALPWDIKREIAFVCPRETCTTLMRTCEFFYHEAAASILSHEIELYNESTAVAFFIFLHAGTKPRYPCHVRHLCLGFSRHPTLSSDSANTLADAIALMTGLVAVYIGSGEYTTEKWPAIGDTITSLPSLQQIFIHSASPPSHQFLFSLQSVKLRFTTLEITDREPEEELSGQPLSTPWLSSQPVQPEFFDHRL